MRQLHPELKKYFQQKLENDGVYLDAVKNRDARTVMWCASRCLVGVREQGGNNKGFVVELLQETIGQAVQEPWCCSDVQSCIAFAEEMTDIESLIFPTEHVLTMWNRTPVNMRVKWRPLRGAIACWQYPPTTNGHCGVLDEYEHLPNRMTLFEGNTEAGLNADGLIVREGGGHYHTNRPMNGTEKMRLLGFLKPF